ncbi:MAG: rhodanese-like domain-containing protein [Acidimicrobiales bacterium]
MKLHRLFPLALSLLMIATACGSTAEADRASEVQSTADGVRTVAPNVGAALQASPPPDLVVLDVRTPEEFSEVHLEGATLVDFYDEDFADQLAALDPDVPYLVYCRSGNRSGQATALMQDLGFADVANVDGGITAWVDAGLPVVRP